jgi:hypothetical protein
METEKVKFWVDLIDKTLVAEQDKDAVNHLIKLRGMLPVRTGDEQYLIDEVCGFIHFNDWIFAKKMFERLKLRIL